MDIDGLPASSQDVRQSPEDQELYTLLMKAVAYAQSACVEQNCDTDLQLRWPSWLFCTAIYLRGITGHYGAEYSEGEFVEMVKRKKEQMRIVLFTKFHRENQPPQDWEPESLLESCLGGSAEGRESYYYLASLDQLAGAAQAATFMLACSKELSEAFQRTPMAVVSVLLESAYDTWLSVLEAHHDSGQFAQVWAFYTHLDGFLSKPNYQLLPSPIPAEFPRPTHGNETRAPLALLLALKFYHRAEKQVTRGNNLNSVIGSLSNAFLALCAWSEAEPLGPNANKNGRLSAIAIRYTLASFQMLNNVVYPDHVLEWFKKLCSVCKTTPAVRKHQYYITWEEQDMMYRFGAHWKLLPRPVMMAQWNQPHRIVAALLLSWAKESQPNSRWDIVIELMHLIFDMCKDSPDPKRAITTHVKELVPNLAHLFPNRSSISPQRSFLLAIPTIVAYNNSTADIFLSVIASKIQERSAKANIHPHLVCSASDLLVWCSLKKHKAESSRVTKAAWQLSNLFADVPDAIKSFLSMVDEQFPLDDPTYLPLLRCIYSKVRIQ
jgi:hypothetical protein